MLTFAQKPDFALLMKSGSTLPAQSPPVHPVLGMQQAIGNQAVQRMLVQRQPTQAEKDARSFVEGVMWMMSESIRQYQRDELITHGKRHPNTLEEDLTSARRWFQEASGRVFQDLGNDPDLQKKLSHVYRVYVYTAIDAFARKDKQPLEKLYAENEKWIEKSAAPAPTGKKWAAVRWSEVVAAHRKLTHDVMWGKHKVHYFDKIVNGGRPKGWPDRVWLDSAQKDLDSATPVVDRVSALLTSIEGFLRTHPILDQKDGGGVVPLNFPGDPIGFLRYCESRFDDPTRGALFRLWHDELDKSVQEVLAATNDMAQAQAVASNVRSLIIQWHITLENYKSMRKSNPQLPEYPTIP